MLWPMDLKEIDWLLREKYGIDVNLQRPHEWPPEAVVDLKRLAAGEPLAYIIGSIPFLGCHIDLSFRPLIPRAETEYWAGLAFDEFRPKRKPFLCLDIFSGSGCLGVALLKRKVDARVDFADINPQSLHQIERNLSLNGLGTHRSRLILSDVFAGVEDRYDLILANPPYIGADEFNDLPSSVRQHEPSEALWGGPQGLLLIDQFLSGVRSYLRAGGEFWLEFDSPQKKSIERMVDPGHFDLRFGKDQYGCWRFVRGLRL